MKPLRILYVGPADRGACRSRLEALQALGHHLRVVNIYSYLGHNSLASRLQMRFVRGPAIRRFNQEIVKAVTEQKFDWAWVDKGVAVYPSTLRRLQSANIFLVDYLNDDFRNPRTRIYWRLVAGVPYYDVHLTIHTPHRGELKELGASQWIRTFCGFDPKFCLPDGKPSTPLGEYATDVIFVGHWEETTEEIVRYLLASGLQVTVWGQNWHKSANRPKFGHSIMCRSVPSSHYASAIASAKIALCLLSKWNRNQHTARTFEIPAIGTFMLAERTDEHLMFYKEGDEAEFFDSQQELLTKTTYYLANEDARERIAQAGHHRAMTSGYTWLDRIASDLQNIMPIYWKRMTL